ncbi:carbonic anhydrase [Holophaga foetida]|uniref:carbonic anhydrase n=1 Tax=Holophaga foetida TaxID=35839 RepID=UPI0002473AC6|nr:carbonic anhydrase [Holophaga foetida]
MLSFLLTAGLCFVSTNEPPSHEEATKVVVKEGTRTSSKAVKHSPAVPEERAKTEKAEGAEEAPKTLPKPVRRVVRKPKPMHAPATLAASEAVQQRLMLDNVKLQQEVAQAQMRVLLENPILTPDAALAELVAGNKRFMDGKRVRSLMSNQDPAVRDSLIKGQAPFAVIITCSDSRLSDNLIFDQGLGRLFTIREAGNCPDIQGLASVEYAVEHLGSKLVVVLGHTACGAVKAVKEAHGKPMPGNLWSLQAAMAGIETEIHEDPNETPTEHLRRMERGNALRQARIIMDRSEIVRHLVAAGKVKVLPALYDLSTGRVTFMDLPAEAPAGHH